MVQITLIKEKNVSWGIVISGLVTFISYLIIEFATGFQFGGFYVSNDIQFILGTIVGVIFTLRYREPHQAILKYGIIVGILGGIMASALICLFLLVLFGPNPNYCSITSLFWFT